MTKRTILILILASSMVSNARSESNAADTFHLVREVVLEKGSLPDPMAIERLNDGGFVIAGRMPKDKAAWATQVDTAGAVHWRYLMASTNPERGGFYPAFTGAVTTSDGGFLLCGTIDLGQLRKPAINGMLVKLDKTGQLINKQVITPPAGSEVSHVAYLDRCYGPGRFELKSTAIMFPITNQRIK